MGTWKTCSQGDEKTKRKLSSPFPKRQQGHSCNRFPVKLGQDELEGTGREVRHTEGFEI